MQPDPDKQRELHRKERAWTARIRKRLPEWVARLYALPPSLYADLEYQLGVVITIAAREFHQQIKTRSWHPVDPVIDQVLVESFVRQLAKREQQAAPAHPSPKRSDP